MTSIADLDKYSDIITSTRTLNLLYSRYPGWCTKTSLQNRTCHPHASPKCSNAPNGGGSKALGAMACNTPHPDLCHQSLSLGARGRSSTDWSVMGYLLSGFEELSSKVLAIGSSRRACNRGGTPRKGLSKSIDSVLWWLRRPTSLTSKFADHWKSDHQLVIN